MLHETLHLVRSGLVRPTLRLAIFILLLSISLPVFTACLCKEGADTESTCGSVIQSSALNRIQGEWRPDPDTLPDQLDDRAKRKILDTRLLFDRSGYRFLATNRPEHFVPYAQIVQDANSVHVTMEASNQTCETMEIRLLDADRMELILKNDYPVIEYVRRRDSP